MKTTYELKVNLPTPMGVLPKGTKVVLLDDHTPLNQSYRAKVVGDSDSRVFPISKGEFYSLIQEVAA